MAIRSLFGTPVRPPARGLSLLAGLLLWLGPALAPVPGTIFGQALAAGEDPEPLPAPDGEVLLVVRGDIDRPNVGDEAHLDRAAMARLPRVRFTTATPWSEAESHTFEGVNLAALLEAVGARHARFEAIGIDDYTALFEGVDLERYPVIIADTQDETPLTRRRLGPLRIMFPFDDHPELLTQNNMAIAVWQLVTLDVR